MKTRKSIKSLEEQIHERERESNFNTSENCQVTKVNNNKRGGWD
jgi:hypothetical protein